MIALTLGLHDFYLDCITVTEFFLLANVCDTVLLNLSGTYRPTNPLSLVRRRNIVTLSLVC